MKKHKLMSVNARMYEQNKYLASRVGELGKELADLRAGCNALVERNVTLAEQLELAHGSHEALHAQNVKLAEQLDAALTRARKSDEMFSRIQALCGSEDV